MDASHQVGNRGCEAGAGQKVGRFLVIPSGDAAPVLELVEGALDDVRIL